MMLDNILKAFPLGTSILCLTSVYGASTDMQSQVDAIKEVNVHGTTGALNPTARPNLVGNGFFATGDYLLWKAEEDGLDFAFSTTTANAGEIPINNGKLLEVHPKWSQGWRFGAGYRFPYDTWDLYLNWTHFFSKAHNKATPPIGGLLFDTLDDALTLVPFTTDTVDDARAKFKLMYNTLDLELGRSYFISPRFSLRPHVGLRGAWISQNLDVIYGFTDTSGSNIQNLQWHGDNDFRGIGVRAGIDLNFYFNKYWSIYGKASAAVLYGTFSVTSQAEDAFEKVYASLHESIHRTRTTCQGAAGVQWESDLFKNRYHLTLSLGYEINEWFHMNQLRTLIETLDTTLAASYFGQSIPRRGNLGLQGATVSARIDF